MSGGPDGPPHESRGIPPKTPRSRRSAPLQKESRTPYTPVPLSSTPGYPEPVREV